MRESHRSAFMSGRRGRLIGVCGVCVCIVVVAFVAGGLSPSTQPGEPPEGVGREPVDDPAAVVEVPLVPRAREAAAGLVERGALEAGLEECAAVLIAKDLALVDAWQAGRDDAVFAAVVEECEAGSSASAIAASLEGASDQQISCVTNALVSYRPEELAALSRDGFDGVEGELAGKAAELLAICGVSPMGETG